MKLNFKYLTMMALALTVGFSSCSSDDDVAGDNGGVPVEGVKTTAKISLTQKKSAGTYAPTGSEAPTATEGEVKTAVLYVFNTARKLEKEMALDLTGAGTGAEKVFELTTGVKYFYAAVNVPTGKIPTIAEGTAMDVAIKTIVSVTADVTELYPAATGFFMSNVTNPAGTAIEVATQAEATAGTKNNIVIQVGRAMIKASMNYTLAGATQAASGDLDNVKFLLANNPKSMYYMPFVNNAGQLETPMFNDATVITANYYPTLGATTAGLTFIAADATASTYGMENSNKVVKQGNASFALIEGKFTPNDVVDKDGVAGTIAASGDFWRIQMTDGSYTNEFYMEDPAGGTDLTAIQVTDPTAAGVKYTGGLCYYAFYLADNAINGNTPAKYTISRNSFWKMTITEVSGPGANTPGGVVPEPEEPIEAESFIKGEIDVLDWAVYDQSGGI